MAIVCWSVKGGSGTTVVAAALALLCSERSGAVAVDLAGDLPAALGMSEPDGPGVFAWMTATPAPAPGALRSLARPVNDRLAVIGRGPAPRPGPGVGADAWERLGHELSGIDAEVVVDAGSGGPIAPLLRQAGTSLLVLRPCYLALRRAAAVPSELISGIVLMNDPGRALSRRDIEGALRRPVVAEVPHDPAVARAVDAGLLLGRMPATISRSLRATA